MTYSSDTGETILSDVEQYRADIADDDINFILGLKDRLSDLLGDIQDLIRAKTLHIKQEDLIHTGAVMHEQLDEILSSDYNRLTGISGSISWPTHLSDYKTRASRIITNPDTLQIQGKL